MHGVEEARALMVSAIEPLGSEEIALDDALGRTLAVSLSAQRDQPPFAASAMDGYALAAADAPGALRIVGESAAGRAFGRTPQTSEALRISTRAPIPAGADTVLIQEEARVEGGVLIAPALSHGKNVRTRGGDFSDGDVLLARGRRLDPGAVALAASAGHARIVATRAPRIAILAGGDEIVAPGAPARADQVYDSASFGVAALVSLWGGQAKRQPPLPDDEDAIARAATAALRDCDLLVMIGGASVGPHDHAQAALRRLQLSLTIDQVSVKPGKPTWFGRTPHGPVLGFPGNPASAMVCARLFLAPMLEAFLARAPQTSLRYHPAQASAPLPGNGACETYVRGVLEGGDAGCSIVRALPDQDSSLLTVLARSNILIRRLRRDTHVDQGAVVSCLPWGFDGF